jgi:hypothetical protein
MECQNTKRCLATFIRRFSPQAYKQIHTSNVLQGVWGWVKAPFGFRSDKTHESSIAYTVDSPQFILQDKVFVRYIKTHDFNKFAILHPPSWISLF